MFGDAVGGGILHSALRSQAQIGRFVLREAWPDKYRACDGVAIGVGRNQSGQHGADTPDLLGSFVRYVNNGLLGVHTVTPCGLSVRRDIIYYNL